MICERCLLGNSRFQCRVELNFIENRKAKVSVQIFLEIPEIFFAGICASWDQTPGDPPLWVLQKQVASDHGLG